MRKAHVLLLALALLALAAPPARAQSPLKLNEFLAGPARDWDGSGTLSTRDDEWIEVVNLGAAPLDLSGYLLTDGDKLPRFGFAGTLAPGAMRVVYGKDSVDWERATGNPVFGLSLANTGDSVMLWQVTGTDTLLVDSYTYLSHEAAADRAVGRVPDGGPWALEDGLDPYTGTTPPTGTGCLPSPGTPSLCGVTPTRNASWGQLKTIYR
jgi:lamin tail-like protein